MSGVLRGFLSAEYDVYASTKTLVRPCSSKKLLISELDRRSVSWPEDNLYKSCDELEDFLALE